MKPFAWQVEALAALAGARERLPHALLVRGRPGIGKVEFARALAAAVLCESGRGGDACGECPSCHWFSQGNHPDYREVVPQAAVEEEEGSEGDAPKAEGKKSLVIKIDQIRAVGDFVALSTHRAGFRVLLIHPAEALHPAAANALLKTLEEPPPATLIVLVSSHPSRLLATLRSRCRSLAPGEPTPAQSLEWLRAQGVLEPEAALAAAGGAPLLARTLAGPEETELRGRVIAELSRPEGADPLAFAALVDRPRLERVIFWMQTWVHDLVRVRLAGSVRHHRALEPEVRARARAADLEALLDLERGLAEARRLAAHPLNPRLLAEHLMMAYNRATSGA